MKMLIALVLLIFGIAHAESQFKVEDGRLKVAFLDWKNTGVAVFAGAEKYPGAVEQAFLAPGKNISVVQEKEEAVVDLLHSRKDLVTTLGVRYDEPRRMISLTTEKEVTKTKESFHFFPLFWLATFVLLSVSTPLRRGNESARGVSFGSLILGAFAATMAIALFASMVGLVAIVAMTLADIYFTNHKKENWTLVFIGYAFLLLSAGIEYYPLFS